jgi:hypothetical protein
VVRAVEVRLARDVVGELARGTRRLVGEHVEPGADILLAHRAAQRVLINDLAARSVDEVGALFHRAEEVCADEAARLGL